MYLLPSTRNTSASQGLVVVLSLCAPVFYYPLCLKPSLPLGWWVWCPSWNGRCWSHQGVVDGGVVRCHSCRLFSPKYTLAIKKSNFFKNPTPCALVGCSKTKKNSQYIKAHTNVCWHAVLVCHIHHSCCCCGCHSSDVEVFLVSWVSKKRK